MYGQELRKFIMAKMMEAMMAWVYDNPPPDMAIAIAKRKHAMATTQERKARADAAWNATVATQNLKNAAKKAAQQPVALMKEEVKPGAREDKQQYMWDRCAKLQANLRIKTIQALEGAFHNHTLLKQM